MKHIKKILDGVSNIVIGFTIMALVIVVFNLFVVPMVLANIVINQLNINKENV